MFRNLSKYVNNINLYENSIDLYENNIDLMKDYRSNHPELFYKKVVLKNFTNLVEEYLP